MDRWRCSGVWMVGCYGVIDSINGLGVDGCAVVNGGEMVGGGEGRRTLQEIEENEVCKVSWIWLTGMRDVIS